MNHLDYPAETKCVEVRRMTLTERLSEERANLQNRVSEIDAVLKALTDNPAVQSVLDLLQKTRCL